MFRRDHQGRDRVSLWRVEVRDQAGGKSLAQWAENGENSWRTENIYFFTISRYWKISSHVIISNIIKSIYHRRVNWYWKILLLVLYNWSITSYNLMYITWKIGILFCPKCCFSILRCNINFLKNKNLHEFTYSYCPDRLCRLHK